jgi:hypothetical protein
MRSTHCSPRAATPNGCTASTTGPVGVTRARCTWVRRSPAAKRSVRRCGCPCARPSAKCLPCACCWSVAPAPQATTATTCTTGPCDTGLDPARPGPEAQASRRACAGASSGTRVSRACGYSAGVTTLSRPTRPPGRARCPPARRRNGLRPPAASPAPGRRGRPPWPVPGNPKPQTPKPQTPNPKPQTPNPKPQTPNPKPRSII